VEIEGFVDITVIRRCGVYLMLWKGEVVYVGQSIKLHSRVSNHIHGQSKRQVKLSGRTIRGAVFDRILVMPCALADLDRVEKELIEKYQPKHNIKHNPKPTMSLDMLIDLMPLYPLLPPAPERRVSSWRRL